MNELTRRAFLGAAELYSQETVMAVVAVILTTEGVGFAVVPVDEPVAKGIAPLAEAIRNLTVEMAEATGDAILVAIREENAKDMRGKN